MKNKNMDCYLKMAEHGHYPLFLKEWLIPKGEDLSYREAKASLRENFDRLSRHRSIQKLQVAIISMKEDERQDFIHSFLKIVEYNSLKALKLLQ